MNPSTIWTTPSSVEAVTVTITNRQTESELEGTIELMDAILNKENFFSSLSKFIETYLELQETAVRGEIDKAFKNR